MMSLLRALMWVWETKNFWFFKRND